MRIIFAVGASLLLTSAVSASTTTLDTNRVQEITRWLRAKPAGLGQPISDRAAWEKLSREPALSSLISGAEALASEPIPVVTDDLFLDYSRTGNRDRCQAVLFRRENRLRTLALAECLENRGRFIKPLADTIKSFCEDRTWVYPAHDGKLSNFYGRSIDIDLRSSALAWDLATVDYLLGDRLDAKTRGLLYDNVERRVLQPFRDTVEGRRPPMHWLHLTQNWNAVCLAGVTGAALAIVPSRADRALFVAAAEQYIRYFLKSFTPDGYCSEGLGYWNYGFGHFLMLGEAIRQATEGHIDLVADPAASAPALFCFRDEIINGIYPTIADCSPGTRPDPRWVSYIRQRFGLKGAAKKSINLNGPSGDLADTLLFAFSDGSFPPVAKSKTALDDSPLRTWFNDGGVLICRPAAGGDFAAVLKGGNNAENHNHDDVGSFSVVCGHTMLVCDPGSEVYTRRTFGPHRYDSDVLNSRGHAVPVIAGQLQRTGRDARAVVTHTNFEPDEDTLAFDLRSAYSVPELKKLDRTFVFQRREPALIVRDNVQLTRPENFETALITWGQWKKLSENELLIADGEDAIRVRIDSEGKPFVIHAETLKADVHTRKKPLRLGIALQEPVTQTAVTLTITPSKP
ncbi:MAG TPA: heparinase II/III family protein [Verrucomicrobiae bacterium]|nr:heparinase II/III family protein [Verrucomicrobiae bacterium]